MSKRLGSRFGASRRVWLSTKVVLLRQRRLKCNEQTKKSNIRRNNAAVYPTSRTLIYKNTHFTIVIMQNPAQGIAPDLVSISNIPCDISKTTRTLLTVQSASPCALYLNLPLSYHANRPSTQDCGMALRSSKACIEPLTILLELPRPSNRWHDYADMAAFSTAW